MHYARVLSYAMDNWDGVIKEISYFAYFANIPVRFPESVSYWTGAIATEKRRHLSNMKVTFNRSSQWCSNEHDGVPNHQPHDCLLNRLSRHRSKKTSKLRVTGLCEGNSPVTGEFPAQRASNEENVSIWWRHRVIHVLTITERRKFI